MISFYRLANHVWGKLPARVRGVLAEIPVVRLAKLKLGLYRNHDDTYNSAYYHALESETHRSVGPIVLSVLRDLDPKTLIDVGCGTGSFLEAFAAEGVRVQGLEVSSAALRHCRDRGLSVHKFDLQSDIAFPVTSRFDVAISMEVAEHLLPTKADRFIGLLAGLSSTVVFTAATPGQGGTDHLNEQPHTFWIERFAVHGFQFDRDASLEWREEWKRAGTASWYHSNLMLFRSVERASSRLR